MALFTKENARAMQKLGAEKKIEKKESRELLGGSINEVVYEVTLPREGINDFGRSIKDNKHYCHATRVWLAKFADPKTAYEALQDLLDRIHGKPKQVEHQRVDLTTGGKAFTGFSSVLPVVPNIEEICAEIDARRETTKDDE